ncbi:cytochrome c-type biogenesis protein [Inquilinus sp. CAU 1745]|uniref:cytochrome c-type biogenesis protein n=1 Tax=Inquilinus sp. CAU 1745 TaxID=3140369 RepID=UPI00325A9C2E
MKALLAVLFLLAAAPALAVEPGERLDDPALEARAREISQELRCLVCQNQSIDDSNADLAHDLRVLVRERLVAGDTDAEVLDYITDRYGDYVLLRPPFQANTLILWLAPAALLLAGGAALALRMRRGRVETAPLTEEEKAAVDALLAEEDRRA